MKIALGCDHAAFELKEAVKAKMESEGHTVIDVGTDSNESVDYPKFGHAVGITVASGEAERGIALCGTGMGVSIICNKHKGVYAALVESVYQARRAKQVNNTNVLCMGGFLIGHEMGRVMTDAWLEMNHMEDMDPEMAAIVGKEYDELVKFDEQVH